MINEINAEMLLNYLYPELQDEWVADCRGTFYRNYSSDALEIDSKEKKVALARDGFLKLLPPEYISPEKEVDKDDVLKRRIAMLKDAFLPIDSIMFRNSLRQEKTIAELLEHKVGIVLLRIFGIDYDAIENPLVKDAAFLLPYVRTSRGDVHWVRKMIEMITTCTVEMKLGRWSEDDNTKAWLPYVVYSVVCDGLTERDFVRELDRLKELEAFVMEHWMPVEAVMRIDLITHNVDSDCLTLNYSAEMK